MVEDGVQANQRYSGATKWKEANTKIFPLQSPRAPLKMMQHLLPGCYICVISEIKQIIHHFGQRHDSCLNAQWSGPSINQYSINTAVNLRFVSGTLIFLSATFPTVTDFCVSGAAYWFPWTRPCMTVTLSLTWLWTLCYGQCHYLIFYRKCAAMFQSLRVFHSTLWSPTWLIIYSAILMICLKVSNK